MTYPKLVHGSMVATLAKELSKQVEYAKTSTFPRQSLYEAHGRISMAFDLGAITTDEYFKLNSECVRDGINNPKYFN
jgi:hypothetical protein